MSRVVTRRTALRGSLAASLGLVAGVASAQAASTLAANDRRLVDLADCLNAMGAQVEFVEGEGPKLSPMRSRPMWKKRTLPCTAALRAIA